MKEQELRENTECEVCGKSIGELALPIFWTVAGERHGLDMQAVSRQQGLAMQLGGNGLLASVMGPNEDLTKTLSSSSMMICDPCVMLRIPELLQADEEVDPAGSQVKCLHCEKLIDECKCND